MEITSNKRLETFRLALGMEYDEIAKCANLSIAEYRGLELHDDLDNCISLSGLQKLAECLGIKVWQLYSDEQPRSQLSPTEISKILIDYIKGKNLSIIQFEELVGWELNNFILNPNEVYKTWNVECLKNVSTPIGVDWVTSLP